MCIPRAEYPRPQFVREHWHNLNGQWQFEIDNGCSGSARGLQNEGVVLSGRITVPFCPESKLSGVEHKDFMYGVWYERSVRIDRIDGLVYLHFGAVDYRCTAYVNGKEVGTHQGGYTSFCFDITDALRVGENEITVFAQDDTRNNKYPSGKQCSRYHSYGCFYTRTTGIWQTVWLEFLPKTHIMSAKYYPNIADCSVTVVARLRGKADFTCKVTYDGRPVGAYSVKDACGQISFTVPLSEKHLWEVGKGDLYDVAFAFGEDAVAGYFGLRQVRLEGQKFLINEKPIFQRLVLDQGFYPDGIYTAPTDEDLKHDIELSLAVGFNGARLHEKVFEERFLYHADKMGYIVWGEFPDWGLDVSDGDTVYNILPEWMEELERDFNHPSIIGWCPRNETWDFQGRRQYDPTVALVYDVTKAIDPTRPCIDTSGNYHVKTDIFCVHDYDQNPATFREHYDRLMTEGVLYDRFDSRQTYRGGPTFVSEYGGIRWAEGQSDKDQSVSWGYGNDVANEEEFFARFKGLTDTLLDNKEMLGLCYTQLTDVEQEQNGLYTYRRQPKFDAKRFYDILSRKSAIEE